MSKRLFVSVDLDGLGEEIAAVQELFADASGLSFTDPQQTHVTLKFLDDVEDGRVGDLVDELESAVEDSGVGPFEAAFGGLGVFPSLGYITVVWLGLREGEAALTDLHETIEDRTIAMGFEPEEHEFTPHATLARMNHGGDKELVQDVVRDRDPDAGSLEVTDVRLTESVLTEDGPEYSTIASISL